MRHFCHALPSLFILLLLSLGVFLFFRGFFLHRVEFPDTSDHTDVFDSSLWTAQKARRVILVVIDALRFDMIEPLEPSEQTGRHIGKLEFVREKLALEPLRSSLFKFIADPPTTTFQRLRALTAGTLPTFAEFLDNFDQGNITEDNWIDQLSRKRKISVQVGDDTWSLLYPKGRISRQFNHPSLNVWDLYSVDECALAEYSKEIGFGRGDWDVLIVHFLGSDHAGHRFKVDHERTAERLETYNEAIRDMIDRAPEGTLLFVMGDHGMTSSGDHGGSSTEEMETALFVYSRDAPFIPRALPLRRLIQSLRDTEEDHEWNRISQVDFVPSLSFMLGLPIPFSSLGRVLPSLAMSAFHLAEGKYFSNHRIKPSFVGHSLKSICENMKKTAQIYQEKVQWTTCNFCDLSTSSSFGASSSDKTLDRDSLLQTIDGSLQILEMYSETVGVNISHFENYLFHFVESANESPLETLSFLSIWLEMLKINSNQIHRYLETYQARVGGIETHSLDELYSLSLDGLNGKLSPHCVQNALISSYLFDLYMKSALERAANVWIEFDIMKMVLGTLLLGCISVFLLLLQGRPNWKNVLNGVFVEGFLCILSLFIRCYTVFSNSFIILEGEVTLFMTGVWIIQYFRLAIQRRHNFSIELIVLFGTLILLNHIPSFWWRKRSLETHVVGVAPSWLESRNVYIISCLVIIGTILVRERYRKKARSLSISGLFSWMCGMMAVMVYLFPSESDATGEERIESVGTIGERPWSDVLIPRLLMIESFIGMFLFARSFYHTAIFMIPLVMLLSNASSALPLAHLIVVSAIVSRAITSSFLDSEREGVYKMNWVDAWMIGTFAMTMSQYWYFSLGHQDTFQAVDWNVPFVGFTQHDHAFAPFMIIFQTFSPHLLGILLLVPDNFFYMDGRVASSSSALSPLFWYRLIAHTVTFWSAIWTILSRRHLMSWGIFAPKFIFTCLASLVVEVCVLLCEIITNLPWSCSAKTP
eukprot:TRINITY_DN1089_c0_g1_i2.p1 TRINITY_DN1089_c0_g1~~TRINITY_DN1089_c0_g1_i2.p1  ORF type:complete len:985 (+),score=201.59 TRINITY_DN1089_c0_g1_i2:81-3035(+)